jgi:dolichol-phosphate mannosyltransferase
MLNRIPTDDPQEALEFTRALSAMLAPATGEQGGAAPEVSVVIPIFNEIDGLPLLFERLYASLSAYDFEIICVDDGSQDGSTQYLREIVVTDERLLLVELSRNFGHQIAISAGLDHARGQGVIIMDADLQDPPEILPQFIEKWREGHDVVYAVRRRRKEELLKRISYHLFYRVLQRIANIEIPLDSGDFCLMDRRVVDILNGMPERNRFVRGIRSWVGLDQVGVPFDRDVRHAGEPKYTYTRLVYLALDGLVSFSYIPLRFITILGFGVSSISIGLAIYYFIKRLTVGLSPPGFATLIVAITLLSGIQMITIGVMGEYIGRIFEEIKRRPLYIVRKVTSKGNPH